MAEEGGAKRARKPNPLWGSVDEAESAAAVAKESKAERERLRKVCGRRLSPLALLPFRPSLTPLHSPSHNAKLKKMQAPKKVKKRVLGALQAVPKKTASKLEKQQKKEAKEKAKAQAAAEKAARRAAAAAAQEGRSMEQGKNKLWDTTSLQFIHRLADAIEKYLPPAGATQDDWKKVAKYMNDEETRERFKGKFDAEICYAKFKYWKDKKNSDGTVSCTGRTEDGTAEESEEVQLVLRFWKIEDQILVKHGAAQPHEAGAGGKTPGGKLTKAEQRQRLKDDRVPLSEAAKHRGPMDGKSSVSQGASKAEAAEVHETGMSKFAAIYAKDAEARGEESKKRQQL